MLKKYKKIGELLVEKGFVSNRDIIRALEIQKKSEMPLGEILLKINKITSDDLYLVLSEHYGIKKVSLRDCSIDYKMQGQFSETYARNKSLIILRGKSNNIKIGSSEPDIDLFNEIRKKIDKEVDCELCILSSDEIEYAHRSIYNRSSAEKIIYINENHANFKVSIKKKEENGRLTMSLVDNIIEAGCKLRASDIHLEPLRERFRVRFRIDGDMNEVDIKNEELQNLYRSVIARFKVLGKLVFDLKKQPQGGSFSIIYDDGNRLNHIDYRISIIPARYGECVVLRVLNQTEAERLKVEHLGITGDTRKKYFQQVKRKNGLILIVGPTGSGKTTTLYTTIRTISGEKKIITIEDPVEFVYPDECSVIQTQVNENKGVGFNELINEIVHQDPDVIVIGEIRNKKSCQSAVEAARTGHLVFATIHAEDSTGIIPRMRDMLDAKVEEFLGQTKMIISQRLIKRICLRCSKIIIPDKEDVERYFNDIKYNFPFYQGTGCELCNYSGFSGRIGLYELWIPNRKIISDLRYAGSDYEVRQAAIAGGLKPFYFAGIDLMKEGKITLDKALESIPNLEEERDLIGKEAIEKYLYKL
ncbi:MAG: hypothetical protein D3922_01120 [Candidatus Electrothrix sp. AR1]|nr:hypothetical protein [Candidatus Electrothrix sp. AR1]